MGIFWVSGLNLSELRVERYLSRKHHPEGLINRCRPGSCRRTIGKRRLDYYNHAAWSARYGNGRRQFVIAPHANPVTIKEPHRPLLSRVNDVDRVNENFPNDLRNVTTKPSRVAEPVVSKVLHSRVAESKVPSGYFFHSIPVLKILTDVDEGVRVRLVDRHQDVSLGDPKWHVWHGGYPPSSASFRGPIACLLDLVHMRIGWPPSGSRRPSCRRCCSCAGRPSSD
jgi:hypothetical protein